jgi:hypothetical protein
MKYKPLDYMLRKNDCCERESRLNGLRVKLNPSISENFYAKENNEEISENQCAIEISTLNENFQSENTADIWNKLRKRCKTKSRTPWQDSLANGFFLKTLEVEKKSTNCDDKNRVFSEWNLQRCKCKDLKDREENEDEIIDSGEEWESPCLCPKYFISKSGLVFGSFEEVGWNKNQNFIAINCIIPL